MLINADFSLPAVVSGTDHHWIPSPQGGVARMMLDRIGAEQARATSLVRYAPGSHFPSHSHPCGEEILVLQGIFSEEGGDYPAGWYLRSPHDSVHQPSSAEGALIFVKLRQMRAEQNAPLRLDTRDPARWEQHAGHAICPLHADADETVALYRLDPAHELPVAPAIGVEILVLSGTLALDGIDLEPYSWIRLPMGSQSVVHAGDAGATLYLKSGHLLPKTGASA